ncbi:hypothetical protein FA10DRAFT_262550 [Acaromyces ingoldii]|uniref:Uncharacterized protein n=1 Tax=Acaromyces ingoldii TaxID=215250 RepID=A0A316YDA0_9BASI|nr:hypothetical protein FA10DRAFT_262550 [Acaromyces ingoldii]PWN87397.1 hypothetical protein FA10DRAFT_262550 [Acaromyces ingoldii]
MTRQPLGELPLSQFARPPSPIKTHSSPAKMSLASSPTKRDSLSSTSSPGPFSKQATPARRRLFEDAAEDALPLETSPVIQRKKAPQAPESSTSRSRSNSAGNFKPTRGGLQAASSESRRGSASPEKRETPESRSRSERTSRSPSPSLVRSERRRTAGGLQSSHPSTPSTSALPKSAVASVPASLPRKKERVRPDEASRRLLDQDEDLPGDSSPEEEEKYVRAGSPSPRKLQEGDGTRHRSTSSFSSISNSSSSGVNGTITLGLGLGLGLGDGNLGANNNLGKSNESWTVWEDNAEGGDGVISHIDFSTPVEGADDKENLKPSPLIAAARKKGTGGRLSLLASGEEESSHDSAALGAVHNNAASP